MQYLSVEKVYDPSVEGTGCAFHDSPLIFLLHEGVSLMVGRLQCSPETGNVQLGAKIRPFSQWPERF